jgi:hypothetical protein
LQTVYTRAASELKEPAWSEPGLEPEFVTAVTARASTGCVIKEGYCNDPNSSDLSFFATTTGRLLLNGE